MLILKFVAGAERDYLALPREVRKSGGFQLKRVQEGKEPLDWKPMPSVGKGVREIRIWERAGTYRIIYYVQSSAGVFVLHAFVKKTQKTEQRDIDLARKRLKEVP
jgi:phage-related protein